MLARRLGRMGGKDGIACVSMPFFSIIPVGPLAFAGAKGGLKASGAAPRLARLLAPVACLKRRIWLLFALATATAHDDDAEEC